MHNSRLATCEIIKNLQLPIYDLAGLAGVPGARLSDYRAGRHLPRSTEIAIENTARDVEFVWRVLGGGNGYFRTDLNDIRGFKRALLVCKEHERSSFEQELRRREEEAAQPITASEVTL